MTDVRLFHTDDGGDIAFSEGTTVEVLQDTGLETAVYLSLFGGNERDSGIADDDAEAAHAHAQQWWGNLGEPRPRQMRSELAHFLQSIPATTYNLIRVEQSGARDLRWMIDESIAREVDVSASLIGVDRVNITVRIAVDDTELVYAFSALWGN